MNKHKGTTAINMMYLMEQISIILERALVYLTQVFLCLICMNFMFHEYEARTLDLTNSFDEEFISLIFFFFTR